MRGRCGERGRAGPGAASDPPSPQTGQVLARGPVLELQDLDREAGGGYRCVASAPRVPGLNATWLVNVAVFGEAPERRSGGKPPRVGVASSWRTEASPAPQAPRGWRRRRGRCGCGRTRC